MVYPICYNKYHWVRVPKKAHSFFGLQPRQGNGNNKTAYAKIEILEEHKSLGGKIRNVIKNMSNKMVKWMKSK